MAILRSVEMFKRITEDESGDRHTTCGSRRALPAWHGWILGCQGRITRQRDQPRSSEGASRRDAM
eukprot:scaffold7785_cov27-Tisochrysis_lutea.AAC.6